MPYTHQKQPEVPKITAKIERTFDTPGKSLKALATLYIGNSFAVHSVRVVDSVKGLFVQMPQSSYESNGKKKYTDIFHAVSAEARSAMNQAVMDAYERELGNQFCSDDDLPDAFRQHM